MPPGRFITALLYPPPYHDKPVVKAPTRVTSHRAVMAATTRASATPRSARPRALPEVRHLSCPPVANYFFEECYYPQP